MNLLEGYNDVNSCNMNLFVKASYSYLVYSRFSQMVFCGTSQFRHVNIRVPQEYSIDLRKVIIYTAWAKSRYTVTSFYRYCE